jgi:Ankyrin repeats (3 copies)
VQGDESIAVASFINDASPRGIVCDISTKNFNFILCFYIYIKWNIFSACPPADTPIHSIFLFCLYNVLLAIICALKKYINKHGFYIYFYYYFFVLFYIARMLIVGGADVNGGVQENGSTLLHRAIEYEDIAFLLIQHGYGPSTPSFSTSLSSHSLFQFQKLNVVRKDRATPLVLAAKYCHLEAVKTLLKEGVKVILLSISSLSFLSIIYLFFIYLSDGIYWSWATHSMSQQNTDV